MAGTWPLSRASEGSQKKTAPVDQGRLPQALEVLAVTAAVESSTTMEAATVEATTPVPTEAKPNYGPTHIGRAVATVVGVVVPAVRVTGRAGRISVRRSDTDEHASRGGGSDHSRCTGQQERTKGNFREPFHFSDLLSFDLGRILLHGL